MEKGLFAVQTGKKRQPFNVILFGVPGIGKSSWAASAPGAVFVGAEETGELDITRYPRPKTYADFVAQVEYLADESPSGNRKCDTLVIDTLDSVETLLHQKILQEDPKKTNSMIAAHGGYGKAYEMAAQELLKLRSKFESIREQGSNLIFLAHSKKVQAVDPILGLQYDTYELNLHQRAQSVFVDWVSAVLFANYVIHPQDGTNTDKIFATGTGQRVILTAKRPGHLGKNRFGLPYEMPLEFMTFKTCFDRFYEGGVNVTDILSSIVAMADQVADETVRKAALKQIDAAKSDPEKLLKIKTRLEEVTK